MMRGGGDEVAGKGDGEFGGRDGHSSSSSLAGEEEEEEG